MLKEYSLIKHSFALKCLLSKLNTLENSEQTSDGLNVIGTSVLNIKYITLLDLFHFTFISRYWVILHVENVMSDIISSNN